jgi:ribonuclease HI
MINKTYPWGFFDGAKKGPWPFSSARGILYLLYSHFVNFKAGLGTSTNNSTKFMALRCLLKLENGRGINWLQVYGDSLLVIN